MKTEKLYLDDSYLKVFEAKVIDKREKGVVLDRTAFYPRGGGLPSDVGVIIHENKEFPVNFVYSEGDVVIHEVQGDIPVNVTVVGKIDWEKRYRIMRLHTAAHVIVGVAYSNFGVLITGGDITFEKGHLDFNFERMDRELFKQIVVEADKLAKEGHNVKIYYMKREEVLKTPGLVKLAEKLPPKIDVLRIVEIEGIDVQADGGPHVANTKEIGTIRFLKAKNVGKGRKRIYYTVE
ncbi:MAG: alanine--tRNA ligase-related protein [Candidatus Baldrarchaeia archaeon]